MPRIRSVHPGQWTDDQFVQMSPWAQLLTIAVRNFADDHGVFEWNPVKLKMQCLPAYDGKAAPLLEEMKRFQQVSSYELDGRQYGLIRNFERFQKPKKPVFTYPLPPSSSVPVPHQSPTEGGNPIQREEGGGNRRREEVPSVANAPEGEFINGHAEEPKPAGGYSVDFEAFWRAYPRKVGKGAAWKAWPKCRKLVALDALLASLNRTWPADPSYIPHPATYLNERRWEDEITQPEPVDIFEGMDP